MSNLEAVTKVADQIISRLFDHRQFTNGEISFMVKELNERVNLEENFDRLLKINENACLISDTYRADMLSAHDEKRKDICVQISSLVDRTEAILRLGSEFSERDEKVLAETRREMDRRRQECMLDCSAKLEKLRQTIVEEELELERKYLKFEENLRDH